MKFEIGDRVKCITSGATSWFTEKGKFDVCGDDLFRIGTVIDIKGNQILVRWKDEYMHSFHQRMCRKLKPKQKEKAITLTKSQFTKVYSKVYPNYGEETIKKTQAYKRFCEALGL